MNAVIFILGGILIVAGIVAIRFSDPLVPWMRKQQARFYGVKLSALTGAQLTPSYVRFVGVVLVIAGVLFVLLDLLGAFASK